MEITSDVINVRFRRILCFTDDGDGDDRNELIEYE